MASKQRWLPLESNPDVMNKYIKNLGVPEKWQFTDVFSLHEDMLMMVPRPVLAVLLLYPLSKNAEASPIGSEDESVDLYFTKQTIGNACGTIAILHTIGNNLDSIELEDGKHFKTLFENTQSLTPSEKAEYLEKDEPLGEAHEESAHEGQTQAPDRTESLRHHFVAFIHKSGLLYEMDGRRAGPVLHGTTSRDTLLDDSAVVIKKFISRDDEEKFAIVALTLAD